jgi:hypothetical protein
LKSRVEACMCRAPKREERRAVGQAAEIQGIFAALEPVLRAARSNGYGEAAGQDLRVSAWVRRGAAGAALLLGPDEDPSGFVDITPADDREGAVATLAETVRPALARLDALARGTGLGSLRLIVRHGRGRDGAERLEVAQALVEGVVAVEATETWSWQNRFREPDAAALAIALVMSAFAEADAGFDLDMTSVLDVRLSDARQRDPEARERHDARTAARAPTDIERALREHLEIEAVDEGHARRRVGAWLRGMRRATGRPEFDEDLAAAAVVSKPWWGASDVRVWRHIRPFPDGAADEPAGAARGRPVAAE